MFVCRLNEVHRRKNYDRNYSTLLFTVVKTDRPLCYENVLLRSQYYKLVLSFAESNIGNIPGSKIRSEAKGFYLKKIV